MSEKSPSYWETVLDKPRGEPSTAHGPPPQREGTRNVPREGARPRLANAMEMTKLYQCRSCAPSFRHIACKYRHYRTAHTNRRELSCTRSAHRFAERTVLQKHYRTVHEGSRLFHCDQCGFRFHFKLHLTQHIATVHGKLRPHHCSECDASFGQRSSLNRHVRHLHLKHATKPSSFTTTQ